jgi:hypothetical protein
MFSKNGFLKKHGLSAKSIDVAQVYHVLVIAKKSSNNAKYVH